jgi:4-hydroxybenzoate polyprenyltransferase
MGFAVILARIDAATLVLYAGSIAWVIGYDTIYARQRVATIKRRCRWSRPGSG